MTPRATYRMQLHRGFTFADAARLAPYLAALGISHLYASPILAARPGSSHGYDVIDPTRVNPELGGENGLRHLVAALRRAGLGIIVDIVPNHMYAGSGNAWWFDVLRLGTASAYAKFFDIDWEALGGKILLPILAAPLADILGAGELRRENDVLRYFDHVLPLAPGSSAVELPTLLDQQHYRLAYWRAAAREINWRRFFDINDLVAVRVEEPDVFEATHVTLLRLYAEGLIDGMRVDHIDGLTDPGAYCRRLRQRVAALEPARPRSAPRGPAYIVVEKILGRGEALPRHWGTNGTTGYDFMNEVSAVLHESAGEAALTERWVTISDRPARFDDEDHLARWEILESHFAAPLNALVARLASELHADANTVRYRLAALLGHFRVYRTYPDPTENNAVFLYHAVAVVSRLCPAEDRPTMKRIGTLLGEPSRLQTQFQQLSAPLAAKAVEDTAFYRYGRLLSRNDVGFDAAQFSKTTGEFHQAMTARATDFPHAMLATATHDHKRGEDVRARLAVLSEIADEWTETVASCVTANVALRATVDGIVAPSPGDEYMLYQTIVGAWPAELALDDQVGLAAFVERLAAWQRKAAREAKLATSWSAPNQAYEDAADAFLSRLFLEGGDGLRCLAAFAHRIGPAGAVNGLSQLLLKLTAPGVPDFYQGTELWDMSLVDPDNRHPVDFSRRLSILEEARSPLHYLSCWRDGRVKQAIVARVLRLRRALPDSFSVGDYLPLTVTGPASDRVVAFARRLRTTTAVIVVTRSPSALLDDDDSLRISAKRWDGTILNLPADMSGEFESVFQSERMHLAALAPIAEMLLGLPVALWVADESKALRSVD